MATSQQQISLFTTEGYETRAARKGHKTAMSYLESAVEYMMLPTPMASDCGEKVTGTESQDSLQKMAREITGKTSQLNPRFVLEMMGFPPDHCDSAFERIAWELYQKKKSTKSFQKRIQTGLKAQLKPEVTP